MKYKDTDAAGTNLDDVCTVGGRHKVEWHLVLLRKVEALLCDAVVN